VHLLTATLTLLVGVLALPLPAHSQVPLGSEFQVNTYTTDNQRLAAIASDPLGNFVVVWASDDQDGDGTGVFGRRYEASGVPIGGEFQVNSYTRGPQQDPSVAVAADGRFVVVWGNRELRPRAISGQRYDNNGSPLGGEFRVDMPVPNGYPLAPVVSSNPEGAFVVVWFRGAVGGGGSETGAFARLYDSSGEPVTSEFKVSAGGSPDVELDTEGSFVVVYRDQDVGGRSSIFGRRYDAGGIPLGEEFRISLHTTSTERDPVVASTGDGGFVVVWEQTNAGVFGQRFGSSGYPVGGEFQVNTTPGTQYLEPDISSDAEGNFVVVYERIRGQAFAHDGTPLGGEFQVKSFPGAFRSYPKVASDAELNFVAAWVGGGTFTKDVYGRRFAGPGLALTVDGSCPGPVTVEVSSAPPNSEVAIVAAANTNGFVKGGALCPGTQFAIGEPFQLPPTFVIVDGNGTGSTNLTLGANRCHLQALAFASCETSNVVEVP
jgi:hypothetical protein